MPKYLNRGISTVVAIGSIAILIVIVGGGILASQYYFSKKGQPDIKISTTEVPTVSSENKFTPTTEVSTISSKNTLTPEELSQRLSECKKEDYSKQNDCYENLAIDANDPTLCPKDDRFICEYFVFMWHTDLCNNIPIKKPVSGGYEKDTATIQDLKAKEECIKKIAIETKNEELCKKLFEETQDCQNAIAVELNDLSKCASSDCVIKIAINKKDISICMDNEYNKAWCIVQFPKLLQGTLSGKEYDQHCYLSPVKIDTGGEGYEIKNEYIYPNTYDTGANDYPMEIAPESTFYHLLSIPFNNSNNLLRVYADRNGGISLLRLVKYSPSSGTSELLGDIRSLTGGNCDGIYIPIGISKDDDHIIFKAHMGAPGAGGSSFTWGYAYLSLVSPKYDNCEYLNPEKIVNPGSYFDYKINYQVYFYDNFSKAIFYDEGENVPRSEKPGPDYNSAIKFINIITGETKTLLEEPNTIYEIINIDEHKGVVNFKSCPWQKDRFFGCPTSDESTHGRSIDLP